MSSVFTVRTEKPPGGGTLNCVVDGSSHRFTDPSIVVEMGAIEMGLVSIPNYFSTARVIAAGGDQGVRSRIIGACANYGIDTVGELLVKGARYFLGMRGIGIGCIRVARQMFEQDGMKGF